MNREQGNKIFFSKSEKFKVLGKKKKENFSERKFLPAEITKTFSPWKRYDNLASRYRVSPATRVGDAGIPINTSSFSSAE